MRCLRHLLPLLALLTTACAHLPEIQSADPATTQDRLAHCEALFPKGEWQYTHAIEIFPPAGSKQTLLGILQISSRTKTFHCVMMTIEGLVLFEAEYDGDIRVRRAIPPLDKQGVAEGMVRDIRLIFFEPEQPCTAAGNSKNDTWICRYPDSERGHEDILILPDGDWQIRRYGPNHKLLRTVAPMAKEDIHSNSPPSRVELVAHGLAGYRLQLRMVEATRLSND